MSQILIHKLRMTTKQTSFACRNNYLSINGHHVSSLKGKSTAIGGSIYQ